MTSPAVAQLRGWVSYGPAVALARDDLFTTGNARVRVRGDSFGYMQPNRLGRSLMTRAELAGSVVGVGFQPSYVVTGGGDIIEASASDTFFDWSTPIANAGDASWRAQSAADAYRIAGQDVGWDQFDGVSRASQWRAMLAHKLGASVDVSGAKSDAANAGAVELFRFVPRLDLLGAAMRSTLGFPSLGDTEVGLRARPIVMRPPQADDVFVYFLDVGSPDGSGDVSPTSIISLGTSSRVARMVANGVFYGSQNTHALTSPSPASGAARQLARAVLTGDNAVDGDIRLRFRNAAGNPVIAVRLNDNSGQVSHPYNAPGAAAGWTVPAMGGFLVTAYSLADGSVPEGIVWEAPQSISSGSFADVYTEPSDGISQNGEKFLGEDNGRRDQLAHAIDDRPVVEIVYLAMEFRSEQALRDAASAMLASIQAEHERIGGGRITGQDHPVRVLLVIPHGHDVASASEANTHNTFGRAADGWRAAVDAYNAGSPEWITAGVVNLYEQTGGNVFGASGGLWSADSLAAARAFLDANGGGSLPTDLLDASDLHPLNAAAADYFADQFWLALQAEPISPNRSIVIGAGGSPTWEKHKPVYVSFDREGMAGLAEHDGVGGPGRRGDPLSIGPDWTVG